MLENRKLISLVGPTATGKSDLAVLLAEKFAGEVISADSRQVFLGLDIGSGKITKNEMHGVPHHLLDISDVTDEYNVSHFARDAKIAISEIQSRNKLPILCGGTGFWVDTVTRGLLLPEVPPNQVLRTALRSKSNAELYALLQAKDPERASQIDKHNPLRLVRALEIVDALGVVPKKTHTPLPYSLLTIGIKSEKSVIDDRIARRLDSRINEGMIEEVQGLLNRSVPPERLIALGLEYRHVTYFLTGKYTTIKAMRDALYLDIIHFAKRQMTWFKRHDDIVWIEAGDSEKAVGIVAQWLSEGTKG